MTRRSTGARPTGRRAPTLLICSVTEPPAPGEPRAFGVIWRARCPESIGQIADATNESEWIVPGTIDLES
jgi:hypothetical protein